MRHVIELSEEEFNSYKLLRESSKDLVAFLNSRPMLAKQGKNRAKIFFFEHDPVILNVLIQRVEDDLNGERRSL